MKQNWLEKLISRKSLVVAGLMSGTSVDGIDAAIVRITGQKVKLIAFDSFRCKADLRKAVLALCNPRTSRVNDICRYNSVLGKEFAGALKKLCKKNGISLSSIDLIGSHGQTIYHDVAGRDGKSSKKILSTLQIAEPAVIAARTGIPVVADFRQADMAAGGQGAPLVPFADYFMYGKSGKNLAIQNIGGIGNVTYLPAGGNPKKIIAFDTGPGNMVIDGLVEISTYGRKKYDRGGDIAARGCVCDELLGILMDHPFFRKKPPKSTGREQFGREYCRQLFVTAKKTGISDADLIATATAFTAATIEKAYIKFLPALPDEIILAGGAVHNKTVVRMIKERFEGTAVKMMESLGIPSDAREAVCFAVLAYASIHGMPANVPSATGAKKPVILGKIIPVLK